MKKVTFSYNKNVIASKEEGNKIEQFLPISFDIDKQEDVKRLEEFFRSHVYSTNKFIGRGNRGQKLEDDYEGFALNGNYTGMYAIGIDYDDGHYTVDEAHEAFRDYVHIIHTSSSHMLDVPRHKGIQPRFRVILPFELSDEMPYLFGNDVDAELVYSLLKERYPNADSSVFSPGRKLYPFTGDLKRYIFKLHIPDKPATGSTSIFYTLTYSDLDNHKAVVDAKSSTKKRSKKNLFLNRNDVIIMRDRVTRKRISDIDKSNTQVFCQFCDDLDSESASGIINIDKHGNYNLHCFHCNKTYWEQDLQWKPEAEPNMFFDATVGFAGMFNDNSGQVKYFKNDKDWANYCMHEDMPKEIFVKLPRADKDVDLKRPFGLYQEHGIMKFNLYSPSKYLEDYKVVQKRIADGKQKPLDLTGLPTHIPFIWRVLKNVFQEDSDIKLFLNWLAFIIQARTQSSLAWIIITSPGAGKGVIGERILRPIFGKHAVLSDNGDAIGAKFNIEDAGCWIKYYNEVFTKANFTENLHRREWLKDRIGTNEILLEAKGLDKVKIKNFVNYLLYSNIEHAFVLEEQDRRFNVVNTLKKSKKLIEYDWWNEIGGTNTAFENKIAEEVPLFAEFIQNVKYDWHKANKPTDTPARFRLIEFSKEDIDFVITKLNEGEHEYFELETIYPSSQNLMGVDPNSDIRAEITEFIQKYHCIPSKYAVQVFGHHMRMTSRVNIKRKLEQRGMKIGKQVWHKETKKNVRCYIHESQEGFCASVDDIFD